MSVRYDSIVVNCYIAFGGRQSLVLDLTDPDDPLVVAFLERYRAQQEKRIRELDGTGDVMGSP